MRFNFSGPAPSASSAYRMRSLLLHVSTSAHLSSSWISRTETTYGIFTASTRYTPGAISSGILACVILALFFRPSRSPRYRRVEFPVELGVQALKVVILERPYEPLVEASVVPRASFVLLCVTHALSSWPPYYQKAMNPR